MPWMPSSGSTDYSAVTRQRKLPSAIRKSGDCRKVLFLSAQPMSPVDQRKTGPNDVTPDAATQTKFSIGTGFGKSGRTAALVLMLYGGICLFVLVLCRWLFAVLRLVQFRELLGPGRIAEKTLRLGTVMLLAPVSVVPELRGGLVLHRLHSPSGTPCSTHHHAL